jgi:hypothetical protein
MYLQLQEHQPQMDHCGMTEQAHDQPELVVIPEL